MDLLNDLKTDKALHRNILKFATMLTVSKAMSLQDAKFLANTVATLVGFTAYHLVTKKIQLPFDNPDLKAVVNNTRHMFVNIHRYEQKDAQHWMEKQTYLNLGTILLGAAALGLDAVPLEGIDAKALNEEFEVAVLIPDLKVETIRCAINTLEDEAFYAKLQSNCRKLIEHNNWHIESQKLLTFYKNLE